MKLILGLGIPAAYMIVAWYFTSKAYVALETRVKAHMERDSLGDHGLRLIGAVLIGTFWPLTAGLSLGLSKRWQDAS